MAINFAPASLSPSVPIDWQRASGWRLFLARRFLTVCQELGSVPFLSRDRRRCDQLWLEAGSRARAASASAFDRNRSASGSQPLVKWRFEIDYSRTRIEPEIT
jgi:hypothetical protein